MKNLKDLQPDALSKSEMTKLKGGENNVYMCWPCSANVQFIACASLSEAQAFCRRMWPECTTTCSLYGYINETETIIRDPTRPIGIG